MTLVAYSDSEGSDSETTRVPPEKPPKRPTSNFLIDQTQPGKIKVNLQQKVDPSSNNAHEDGPSPKRQRLGAGGSASFNSMLPAPKRENASSTPNEISKTATRKVFSLKTGAEASFNRQLDADLRNQSAEYLGAPTNTATATGQENGNSSKPAMQMPSFAKPAKPIQGGSPFMFKPLSVARGQKKKNPGTITPNAASSKVAKEKASVNAAEVPDPIEVPKKKVSLFSAGADYSVSLPDQEHEEELHDDQYVEASTQDIQSAVYTGLDAPEISNGSAQTLDSIASDLNLTAAQRRQLFGRTGNIATSAINVANFNTDQEYAANQALIAAGETVQHNPVRAIAPGKHSLRQLVNAASGQKEALEESFAEGRRNKKEAGSKYGW